MNVQYLQTYLRKVAQDFHAFSLHELGCSVRYALTPDGLDLKQITQMNC